MTREITKEDIDKIEAAIKQGTPSPGPWAPMGDGPKPDRKPWEPWTAFMEAAPGLTIGSAGHTEPVCRVSGYLRPVVANARLIAAAPDLLAALKAVSDGIISSGSGPIAPIFDEFDAAVENKRGTWYTVDGATIDHARAAIAKAEGE